MRRLTKERLPHFFEVVLDMGYVFLAAALLAGVTKGYCGKKTSGYTKNFRDAILANLIRMILCGGIGFVLILLTGELKSLAPTREMLLIAVLSGVSTAVFVVTWLVAVKKSAYMMLDVFLMLGVLIPLIASNVLFGEEIRLTQWLGIGVLFAAVLLMCSYNNTIKVKLTLPSVLLLILCGAANGIADFSQKLFVRSVPEGSAAVFNFYTYVFTFVILLAAFFLLRKPEEGEKRAELGKISGYIFVMALCLFANSFFKTLAAEKLSAVLLYPLNNGCALILSAVMSSVMFRERLTAKAIIGLATAFAGLLIINLL